MLKYTYVFVNTLVVLMYNLLSGDDVKVTAKFPASAQPNTEYVCEVTIAKGSTSGFSKLQFDVPVGFTATEIESKGGKFAFDNSKVKITWMSVPADAEFTVKFNLKTSADASGMQTFKGKYSYILNNAKQEQEIGPIEMSFGGASPVASTEPVKTPETTEPVKTPETTPVTPEPTKTPETTPVDNFAKSGDPNAVVKIDRSIVKEGNDYIINLVINKGSITGFAKLLETLPAEVTASEINSDGGTFTFLVDDKKTKIIWTSIPTKEIVNISYKVKPKSPLTSNQTIEGEFNYLENNQTQKIACPSGVLSAASASSEPVVVKEPVKEPIKEPVAEPTKEPVKETTPVKEPVVSTEPVSKSSSVKFSVQIGAFANGVNASVLARKYSISDKVRTDMHNGMTKCLVGSFDEYKSARDHREKMIGKGVSDAFVAAYNAGTRITVQEALMMSNQKWLK